MSENTEIRAALESLAADPYSEQNDYYRNPFIVLLAAIQEAARSCGALVTAEEHQLAGGLFGAVSEVVVRTCPVPMEAVAVQDTFGESGPPEALLVRYGLNADASAQAVRRCLARKG